MPARRSHSSARTPTRPSRAPRRPSRSGLVWLVFFGAMTVVVGFLGLMDSRVRDSGFLLASLDSVAPAAAAADPVLQIHAPLQKNAWSGIVIHHLGAPAGDAISIQRAHKALGFDGLAYHFVIGNGNGLGDGIVHVGYRWNEQKPGLRLNAPGIAENEQYIHICLVGNGDRHEFTSRQMATLTNLVQRLQRNLDLPADRVKLMRDLSHSVTSPGRYFDEAALWDHLLTNP